MSLILTSSGYKQIQHIQDSDYVFTHKSSWRPIVRPLDAKYNKTIVSVTCAASTTPIEAIAEQPFLTKGIISTGFGESDFVLSEDTSWIPAISLKAGKHMLCLPIEQSSKSVTINIEVDGHLRTPLEIDWFMVGFYVGKGTHAMEVKFIPPGWNILREFTSNPNTENAICDHIPEWVQQLPSHKIEDFINGFEKSSAFHNGFMATNDLVALSMQRLYAKLKRFVAIDISADLITLHPGTDLVSFDEDYMYIPIENIKDIQKELLIYNVEGSYIVENVVTRGMSY